MIAVGQQVHLDDGAGGTIGVVVALLSHDRALIRCPSGGTLIVPLHLLGPKERPALRKSAPRRQP